MVVIFIIRWRSFTSTLYNLYIGDLVFAKSSIFILTFRSHSQTPNMNPNDLFSLDDSEEACAFHPPTSVPLAPSASIAGVTQAPRLPNFWCHSPREWFLHADAVFSNQKIRSDNTRVNYILTALDEEGVKAVADLIGPDASYVSLKDRLISTYSASHSARLRTIVQPGNMGDRRPSQVLRDMRAVLPDNLGDTTLKEFWLQKLPTTIRAIVSGFDGTLSDIAERADRVMEASSSRDIFAVQSNDTDNRLRAMETAILALTTQVSNLLTVRQHNNNNPGSGRGRGRSKSRSRTNANWCHYHDRYGADARHCKQPCAFKSEN